MNKNAIGLSIFLLEISWPGQIRYNTAPTPTPTLFVTPIGFASACSTLSIIWITSPRFSTKSSTDLSATRLITLQSQEAGEENKVKKKKERTIGRGQ